MSFLYMLRGDHKLAFQNVSILSKNRNDEKGPRDLINDLIISNINKRDHLTRRIHYKLLGCSRMTPKKILFHFIFPILL